MHAYIRNFLKFYLFLKYEINKFNFFNPFFYLNNILNFFINLFVIYLNNKIIKFDNLIF